MLLTVIVLGVVVPLAFVASMQRNVDTRGCVHGACVG